MQKSHFGSLDLDVLEAFSAVMRWGSVSDAARALGATQPVLSQRLRRMRAIVGDPLFVRTPKRMIPTSRAERMAAAVEAALEMLRAEVADRPTFDPLVADRRFSLIASGFGAAIIVPVLIAALKDRAPFVRLQIRSLDVSLHAQLSNGDADVAFGILSAPEASINTANLYTDRLCTVRRRDAPPTHRWAIVEGQQLPFSTEPSILQYDAHAEIVLRTDSIVSLPGIIAESDLQVLLPHRLAQAYLRRYPLEIHAPAFSTPIFSIGIMWHERREHDPAQRWFRKLIAEPYVDV